MVTSGETEDISALKRKTPEHKFLRAIASQFGHSTKTVLKALTDPQPKPHTLAEPRPARVFDAVRQFVHGILTQNRTAPPKQRHTASQIFRRLVAEHNCTGSYDPVQRYLKQHRLDRRETFVPSTIRPVTAG